MFSIPEETLTKYKFLIILYFSYAWIPARREYVTISKERYNDKINHINDLLDLRLFKRRKSFDKLAEEHLYIPKLPFVLTCYFILSSSVHTSVVIFNSITMITMAIPRFEPIGQSMYCNGPRLMIQRDLSGGSIVIVMPIVISLFHLVYRYILVVYRGRLKLPVVPFIMSDNEAIKDLFERVEDDRYDHATEQDPLFDSCYLRVKAYSRTSKTKPKYVLRLNRSLDHRKRLLDQIDHYFCQVFKYFILSVMIFSPISTKTLILDHDAFYSGCEVKFLNLQYFIRLTGSVWVTIFVLLDTFMAFFIPMSSSKVIISDLIAYWDLITEKLHNTLVLLYENTDIQSYSIPNYPTFAFKYNDFFQYRHHLRNLINQSNASSEDFYKSMEQEMKEIQTYTVDFFDQLHISDKYLSLIIKIVLSAFFINNSIITGYGIHLGPAMLTVRALQTLGTFILCTQNQCLTVLRQRTGSTYSKICTLMCLDQSKTKRTWKNILGYYTEKPRYGVSLAFNEMYSNLTFLKFVSYTVTFVMVVDNLKQIKNQYNSNHK